MDFRGLKPIGIQASQTATMDSDRPLFSQAFFVGYDSSEPLHTCFLYPYKRKKYDGKFLFLGGFILSSVWLAEFHCNKGNQAHYMVSDHGKTALVLLGNNKLFIGVQTLFLIHLSAP